MGSMLRGWCVKDRWRPWLLKKVEEGFPTNVRIQAALGLSQSRPKGNPVVTGFFHAAAALGTEITFILVLPLVFWNFSMHLGCRMVVLWGVTYYVGQYMKDYFQLPRPSKPVIQLEPHYAEEYGLPSTHVMGGLTTPIYVWSYFYSSGDISLWTIAFPLFWFGSVSLSRLYLGAHSPLDCQAGFVLALAIMLSWWACNMDFVFESWMHSSAHVIEIIWLVVFLGIYIYPRPDHWVSSFGDTAIILGVVGGVVSGTYLLSDELLNNTAMYGSIPLMTFEAFTRMMWRFLLGASILVLTRVIVKEVLMLVIPLFLPASSDPPGRRFAVEIPTKMITYGAVGMAATVAVPTAFVSFSL